MREIPLNLLTLYADLLQSVAHGDRGASISERLIDGKRHLYAIEKDGAVRRQRYLGPADRDDIQEQARLLRHAAGRARAMRSTVSAIKAARIPAPELYTGRLLEVLANAGLFENGVVLIGTLAYQLFPCIVGRFLSAGALKTNDADLLIARIAAPKIAIGEPLEQILKRADASFAANMVQSDRLPKNFVASNTFQVDVVTHRGRSDRPVLIKGLQCAAIPLRYMEYLTENAIDAVALYGSGVLVRVPDPARYAVHKLIIMGERPAYSRKAGKDQEQARELFEALEDSDTLADAIADARARGPKWRKAVDAGLKKIGRGLDGERIAAKT
jgi:hypothetical protein